MKKCIVFGSGSAYVRLSSTFNVNGISVIGIVDNDKNRWGVKIQNLVIEDPQNISNYKFSYVLICSSFYKEISVQLKKMGLSDEQIINYYELVSASLIGRNQLANSFINYDSGYKNGIEIGPGHAPIKICDNRIQVKYVDYMQHTDAEKFYKNQMPIKIDIIDNGETLNKIEDESQDFIIACHMLEHCRNPIGTIKTFLMKSKKRGIIFLAIPDKRYTVDSERELTTVEHLILDDREPNLDRDLQHFSEDFSEDSEIIKKKMEEHIIDLHYHVWNADTFGNFLYQMKEYLNNSFDVEQCGTLDNGQISNEIIVILRKK